MVMDEIMETRPARTLSAMLLASTIWVDATNGHAYMAHDNDGLVFELAYLLGMELGVSLFPTKTQSISYSAIAMDLSQMESSPVFIGEEGYYHIVVWLNSFAAAASQQEEGDGLNIYGPKTWACLLKKRAAIDFKQKNLVSLEGSLDVVADNLCPNEVAEMEFVPRKYNRMIVIGPNRPFLFKTSGDASLSKKSFDMKAMIAMVFRLKKAR